MHFHKPFFRFLFYGYFLQCRNESTIVISIENLNRNPQYCEVTIEELEMIYTLSSNANRAIYECICDNSLIKAYIDFEYLLEISSSVNHHRSVLCCLKLLFFYLNNTFKLPLSKEITVSSILNQFLILNAYVYFIIVLYTMKLLLHSTFSHNQHIEYEKLIIKKINFVVCYV